jgi:dihydrodipicolinate synthase/N-acetylneuraminate lyase
VNGQLHREQVFERLKSGLVIPAHPLALTRERKLDERHQRALTRYYCAAGAGGIAVGVHTTQFAIREPKHGLFRPVVELAAATAADFKDASGRELVLVGGVCGKTAQAVEEASFLRSAHFDCALLSLSALRGATVDEMIDHARAVGEILPVMGFYLQPAVGGQVLPYAFWRRLAELECVIAIKIAPFNRYQTFDVIRGVADSGRANEIALYTGNDDTIVSDLLTAYRVRSERGVERLRFCGGLLGHWACWTRRAVSLLAECKAAVEGDDVNVHELLLRAVEVTDSNSAFFDAANQFHGCIAGIHEVLLRQGLMEGRWCLDPNEDLSPGQLEEIDRVYSAYPHLNDDAFVAQHLDTWLQ